MKVKGEKQTAATFMEFAEARRAEKEKEKEGVRERSGATAAQGGENKKLRGKEGDSTYKVSDVLTVGSMMKCVQM